MKRRMFFWGAAGALVGQTASRSGLSAQTSSGHQPLRMSRLYDRSTLPRNHVTQDILTISDTVVCLHGSAMDWKVTATNPAGDREWEYSLPKGMYSSLSTTEAGTVVLIHAFSCTDGTRFQRNRILRLTPKTGSVEFLGSTDTTGTTARMYFAGDSFLIRPTKIGFELWSVRSEVTLVTTAVVEIAGGIGQANVDLISPQLVAITRTDGTAISTISIPSGDSRQSAIAAPEIVRAQSILYGLTAGNPIEPGHERVSPSVLAVTGGDPVRGVLNALVVPVRMGDPTPLIKIDASGKIVSSDLYDINHNLVAMKLITAKASELGVVYGDASVGWYPA